MAIRPYGTWPAALDADLVARASSPRYGYVDVRGRVRWAEARADEGGRAVVVEARRRRRGRRSDPARRERADARPRVRRRRRLVPRRHRLLLRVLRQPRLSRGRPGAEPQPITPEPAEPHALRYADGVVTPDGGTVICVRERHAGGEVRERARLAPGRRLGRAARARRPATTSSWRRASRPDGQAARVARVGSPADAVGRHGALGRRLGALDGRSSSPVAPTSAILDPQWSPGRRPALLLRPHRLVESLPRGRHGADRRSTVPRSASRRGSSAMRCYAFLDDGRIVVHRHA